MLINVKTSVGSIQVKGSNISISFVVYSPRETGVDVNTSGGSVSAENLEGQIQLRTSGGSVSIQSLSGIIDARTSGGTVRMNYL